MYFITINYVTRFYVPNRELYLFPCLFSKRTGKTHFEVFASQNDLPHAYLYCYTNFYLGYCIKGW